MTLVEWPVRHLAGLDLLSLRLSHSFPPQTHTFTTTFYYLCLPQRYLSLSCVTLRVLYYRLSEPQAQQIRLQQFNKNKLKRVLILVIQNNFYKNRKMKIGIKTQKEKEKEKPNGNKLGRGRAVI